MLSSNSPLSFSLSLLFLPAPFFYFVPVFHFLPASPNLAVRVYCNTPSETVRVYLLSINTTAHCLLTRLPLFFPPLEISRRRVCLFLNISPNFSCSSFRGFISNLAAVTSNLKLRLATLRVPSGSVKEVPGV